MSAAHRSPAAAALAASLTLGLLLAAGCDGPPVTIVETLQELPSEHGWEPPVPVNGWKYIIVHHSGTPAGSAKIFDDHHRNNLHWVNGLGYDFVIGNGTGSGDGEVEVGGRWTKQIVGAHVKGGDWNKVSIGVCLVGNFQETHPTEKQMASLHKLLNFLQTRCQISSRLVFGHREVMEPGYTECPGKNFSMVALRASLPVGPPVYRAVNGNWYPIENPNGTGSGNGSGSESGHDTAPVLIDPDTGEPFQAIPVPEMSAPKRRLR